MKPIYLDYNATTPVDPRVARAMLPFLEEHFGNPSSSHYYGRITKEAVDKARQQVANMLGCAGDELIFTSGGSESNNYAIRGVALASKEKGNHIISSNIEHPAIIEVCEYLKKYHNCEITYVESDNRGYIDPASVEKAITDRTILITIMHANNEVGTIEPIREIADMAHKHGIIMHTDAAQSIGKIPVNVDQLGVDLLSVAGHKVYGPKGIGALYIRENVALNKLIHGAGQEFGLRAGTENVLEIVGLGQAAELISEESDSHSGMLAELRDRLQNELIKRFADIAQVNGHPEKRLPNTLNISFKNIRSSDIMSNLETVAISAGAACHSDGITVSAVLQAMDIPLEYAMGSLRISVGRFTSYEDVERAINDICEVIDNLK